MFHVFDVEILYAHILQKLSVFDQRQWSKVGSEQNLKCKFSKKHASWASQMLWLLFFFLLFVLVWLLIKSCYYSRVVFIQLCGYYLRTMTILGRHLIEARCAETTTKSVCPLILFLGIWVSLTMPLFSAQLWFCYGHSPISDYQCTIW